MRRWLAMALIVAALSAACGAEPDTGSGTSGGGASPSVGDPEAPVSSSPDATTDLPRDGGRAERVRPRPGMADLRSVAWEKARQTSSGRSLRVIYWSGVEPCNVLDHVEVRYETSRIVVTLFEGYDPEEPDVACIEIALLKAVVVKLEQPVDGRKIVDGAK